MKTRHIIFQAYLHILAFALLVLGSIGLLDYLLSDDLNRYNMVLLPDSSLVSVLLGIGLLSAARNLHRLRLLAVALLLSICLYTLLHNLLVADPESGRSLISGFLRMHSALAILSSLLALAILSANRGAWGALLSRLLGVAVILVILLSQLTPLWSALGLAPLGFKLETNSIAHLLSLLLGIAVLLLPLLPTHREQLLDRLTLSAGVLGVLITGMSWYVLSQQNIEGASRQSSLLLSKVQLSTERTLSEHLALMRRMAERWESAGQLPGDGLWHQEAGSYLHDFPGLGLVAVLDRELSPQRLLDSKPAGAARLQFFLEEPHQRAWLTSVQYSQQARIGDAVAIARGNDSSLLAVPLNLPQHPGWMLVASLNLTSTLHRLLGNDFGGLALKVFEDQQVIFDSTNQREPGYLTPLGEQLVQWQSGNAWRLVSYQGAPRSDFSIAHLPSLVMLFGLAFSFFIMISQRLGRLAVEHAQHLQSVNQKLEASLWHQANLQALNQRIMEFSMDVLCSIDEQGRFIQLSPSAASVLGYQPDELTGRPYLDNVVPGDRAATLATMQAMMAGEDSQGFRNSYRRKNGSIVHLYWSGGWSESERTLFAVAHDITRLVQNEAYAEDHRDILSMISTDQPLAEILKAICQLAESQDPTARCSVLLVDKEQKHLLHGAAPSLPDSFNQGMNGRDVGPHAGSCGTAVYRRQLVIAEDISHDPLWQEHRALALRHGLRACWSIPLISHHGDVLGTFAIYHRGPKVPDDEQLHLIGTVGQLAAIAIERQHDRLRLQESEQRYRSLFTFNPDPVFSFDLAGRFESMNQAGCQLCGYSEEELLGQHMSLLIPADDMQQIHRHLKAATKGGTQRYEVRCQSRDGQLLELDITNLPIIIDGQIVGVFGIAKDISEHNRMTRALREALQHSEHQAELLRGLSQTAVNINSIIESQALLDYMTERLRLLLGAHQSAMSLTPGTHWAQSIDAVSLSEKYATWQDYRTPPDVRAIYALACEANQPLLLSQEELERHPRWRKLSAAGSPHPPLRGWLAVPLKDYDGSNLGLLQLSDKYIGEFDQDDLAIAQQFAQMAVVVLENNRLMHAVIAGERRLKTQLEFTSAITNSIAEGLLAVDRQGLLSFINPTAAELLGRPADVLLGQTLARYLPLPLNDSAQTSSHGEMSLSLTPLGERHIAYDSAPLLDDDGPQGWVVAFRDITAHKEADKQLRLLKRSLEASYNGALICDAQAADLPIIYVNPAFERITGYSAAEAIGRNCRFLQGEEQEQPGISEIRQSLIEKRDAHVVLRNFRKDGTPFWNDLYIAPVPNEQGEITHFIGVQNDISAQKRFESELAFNASHDVLTGLPNRSLLEDRLSQGCQISRRYKRSLAVMFIDLDGFKPINDTMGHNVGDQILIEVARRMNQQVRPGDTVARLGGDEFIVILPDLAREEDVLLVADRIVENLARPYKVGGSELHITASIGITLSDGSIEQPMQLIQQADLAMYKAKQQGRNNYQWYTEDLNQKVSERVTLRNELQKAIEAEAFELYYQPQVDARSGRVAGYEALLRWQHAEQGFISPAQFVPVAEDTGQIIPLSEWVLSTACRQARQLFDQGWNSTVMAVNISPVQFQRANFVETVRAT
ncbi:MAG: PAS domain S-box protein, partial [Pseudomonas sp.]